MDDLLEMLMPSTPEGRGRLLRLFWVISFGMMILGFFLILVLWNR